MKLIKINTDHYVVVDDSEIKEGDWVINGYNKIHQMSHWDIADYLESNSNATKKITHSTQPLKWFGGEIISLQEVKELIGEVNVEKKAQNIHYESQSQGLNTDGCFNQYQGYIKGYNQALEDNKEKKYTEEDLMKFYKYVKTHTVTEALRHIQPKTEWEVEIVDGKLKLK